MSNASSSEAFFVLNETFVEMSSIRFHRGPKIEVLRIFVYLREQAGPATLGGCNVLGVSDLLTLVYHRAGYNFVVQKRAEQLDVLWKG